MNPCIWNRRRVLQAGLGLAGAVGIGRALAAPTIPAPTGHVVLTLSGHVGGYNTTDGIAFDMEQLEALPAHSYDTHTPWYPKPRKFTGVLLRDLFTAVGAARTSAQAVALNDYRATIPADDIFDHDVMVAYRLDDQPMTVREKGPLVIIYPFDEKPDLRDAVYYSRAVWQLRRLELQ
ncbi:MAG: molybdopterin-dependent oxidoreductase [Proteobacteria bacterium]|nr:molybdopterin-dependent oxidoreductase [Pseudomonadota bacterium]